MIGMSKIIIITGKIACGKTSVMRFFADKGYPVVSMDHLVHQLYADADFIKKFSLEFGGEYVVNGKIDRTRLGKDVFSDPDLRSRLEKYVHPMVIYMTELEVAKHSDGIVFVEVPLLEPVYREMTEKFQIQKIWFVDCSKRVQFERLKKRDALSDDEVCKRCFTQIDKEDEKTLADTVIVNNGTFDELEKKLDLMLKEVQNEEST